MVTWDTLVLYVGDLAGREVAMPARQVLSEFPCSWMRVLPRATGP